jgi:uncharacterized protein (UPF0297 family)
MGKDNFEHTRKFNVRAEDEDNEARQIVFDVYRSLIEKGYNPINQLVGYLLSGDPAYITSHNHARSIICRLERDELLEELVSVYLNELEKK